MRNARALARGTPSRCAAAPPHCGRRDRLAQLALRVASPQAATAPSPFPDSRTAHRGTGGPTPLWFVGSAWDTQFAGWDTPHSGRSSASSSPRRSRTIGSVVMLQTMSRLPAWWVETRCSKVRHASASRLSTVCSRGRVSPRAGGHLLPRCRRRDIRSWRAPSSRRTQQAHAGSHCLPLMACVRCL